MKKLILFFSIYFVFYGCKEIQSISDKIFKPSARAVYSRDFREDHSLYKTWNHAFNEATKSRLTVGDPYVFQGNVTTISQSAFGYKLELEEGEKLLVDIQSETDTSLFFIDFYQYKEGTVNLNKSFSADFGQRKFSIDIQESGWFQLIIQPAIGNNGPFQARMYTQPTYLFPVWGKENNAVKSFWGASRDGGRRSHEGVDVFADRGTPVVATTDGFISRTGNYGLGGKQVWLKDGLFGHSLYYAHLDSIIAKRAQRVEAGDTLGLVGNTGNAQTTPPHLHFGIYTRDGAVNPYPFIQIKPVPVFQSFDVPELGRTRGVSNLRLGPTTDSDIVNKLPGATELTVLAKSKNWLEVRAASGETGFIYESLVVSN